MVLATFFSTAMAKHINVIFVKRTKQRLSTAGNAGAVISSRTAKQRWAHRLATDVNKVMAKYPDADPEDVRLTLISLQSPPLERLNRSLRRGRGFAAFRR